MSSAPAQRRPGSSAPLRVCLVQPSLAAYRVPVFRTLAARDGIDLKLIYASTVGLTNARPDGFAAVHEPMTIRRLRGHPFYWQPSMLRYADRAACDVLMLNWDAHYLSTAPALFRARRAGVGTVLWGHGYARPDSRGRRIPREALLRLADAAALYNDTGRERLIAHGHLAEKLFVAHNAIDHAAVDDAIAHHRAHPDELDAFKRSLDLDRRPLLLFVSRIQAARRLELLVDASAALIRDGVEHQVALVGAGEGDVVAQLQDRVAHHHLGDRYRFVGPCYGERELSRWFLAARAFCFPSFIGLSLQHAFAYGLPVVTTDDLNAQGPEAEALVDNETGLTYRRGDASSLASALRRLLTDPALAQRLGTAGRRVIDTRFNIARMVDGLEASIRHAAAVAGAR